MNDWLVNRYYLHIIHLLHSLFFLFFSKFLYSQEPVLPQLDPLGCVANTSIFYQSTKHHEETDSEVNIYWLHVRDLGERSVDTAHERGHSQHSGDTEADASGGRATVQPEGHPGHAHNQARRNVHLKIRNNYILLMCDSHCVKKQIQLK